MFGFFASVPTSISSPATTQGSFIVLPFNNDLFVRSSFVHAALIDHFNLSRPPGLVEPRLQRTVQPQADPPPLAGDGLYPVGLLCRAAAPRRK